MTTVTCSVSSCGCAAKPTQVVWRGAQQDVLGGDLRGHVDLRDLEELRHLYGLGPLEGVRGEVTILHSDTSIARVTPEGVVIETGFGHRACFFVWSQVPEWRQVPVPDHVVDEKTLEAWLPHAAAVAGLDPQAPFPFLLRGRPGRVIVHILNKTDNLPHSPELHEKAKVRYTLEGKSVQVIGFHSREHRGIFTPRDSNIHLHLRTYDATFSGHVDRITIPGLDLFLPGAACAG